MSLQRTVQTNCVNYNHLIKVNNNYRGISLLSASFKILSNIILSRLSPYVGEIIGYRQRMFRRSRSVTDQIFCISQTLEEKNESAVRQHISYS
jgi:hypothetical protein